MTIMSEDFRAMLRIIGDMADLIIRSMDLLPSEEHRRAIQIRDDAWKVLLEIVERYVGSAV